VGLAGRDGVSPLDDHASTTTRDASPGFVNHRQPAEQPLNLVYDGPNEIALRIVIRSGEAIPRTSLYCVARAIPQARTAATALSPFRINSTTRQSALPASFTAIASALCNN